MKQKKIQNGRLRKFKMAASKKPHFPAPPILNIFSWNFYGFVLGLVELIDAKGIGMAQLIMPYSEVVRHKLKNRQKMHFWCFRLSGHLACTLKIIIQFKSFIKSSQIIWSFCDMGKEGGGGDWLRSLALWLSTLAKRNRIIK